MSREKPFVGVHIFVVSHVFHGVPETTVPYYRDRKEGTVDPSRSLPEFCRRPVQVDLGS